jgi:CubicO group peptidase (beta-lactamase class C family)
MPTRTIAITTSMSARPPGLPRLDTAVSPIPAGARKLCGISAFARRRVLPALLAATLACGDAATAPPSTRSTPPTTTQPIDLSADWVTTAPGAQGVDAAALATGLGGAAAIPGLRSILVVRHGRLVTERYTAASGADSLYALRSVTKSVMSLLVGSAIQRGAIRGTDQTLGELFRPPLPSLAPADAAISVGDLLTMTGGFQSDESGVTEYNNWVLAPDQIDYLLARPIVSPPGTTFNYNSAAVHLLSAVLEVDAGGTAAFADSVLLSPLGIHARDWELDHRGIPNGGAGLYLRPRDIAKLGQLVLQRGRSGATEVVPPSWVDEATRPHIATGTALGSLGTLGYGDLFWLGSATGHAFVLAWGYGGRLVYVVPDLDLVVVTTAMWQGLGTGAGAQTAAIAGLIVNGVLPAVQ